MFQRYLLFKKDHSELLFYILRQLAKDQLTFIRGTNAGEALTIEIDEKDLIDKVCIICNDGCYIIQIRLTFQAKQIDIRDVKPFYQSSIFEANNFIYDSKRKIILHTVPETLISED